MQERHYFLDGLRGWAAFLVMLLHIFYQILPPIDVSVLRIESWWPFTGKFSVATFFLVSGFSLSVGFLSTGDKRPLLRSAAGRYLRLFIPVAATCIMMSILLNAGLIPEPAERPAALAGWFDFDPTLMHLVKFSVSDVFFNYSLRNSYAPPLWTISYELFGSMLVYAVLLVLCNFPKASQIYLAIAAALFIFAPWYSLFVIGVICVRARERLAQTTPPWVGLVFIVAGTLIPLLMFENVRTLVLASTLFFVGSMHVSSVRGFFSNRFSQALGTISFPLYLVHVPVTFATGLPLYILTPDSPLLMFGAGVVATVASVLVSIAFIPINNFAMQVSRRVGSALTQPMLARWEKS